MKIFYCLLYLKKKYKTTINKYITKNKKTLTLDVNLDGFLYTSEDYLCCDIEQKYFNSVPYEDCDFTTGYGSIDITIKNNDEQILNLYIKITETWEQSNYDSCVYEVKKYQTIGDNYEIVYDVTLNKILNIDNTNENYNSIFINNFNDVFSDILDHVSYVTNEKYPNDIMYSIIKCLSNNKTQISKDLYKKTEKTKKNNYAFDSLLM